MTSIDSKKLYIKDNIGDLCYDDRLHILSLLIQDSTIKVIESLDGCRVNMDIIADNHITKIYAIISSKLNTLSN